MTDILSHPSGDGTAGTPLEEHLRQTAERGRALVPDDADLQADGRLDALVYRVGLLHDVGKATRFFQDHIRPSTTPEGPTHHAPLGGYVVDYALDVTGHADRERLAGFIATSRHHGALPDTAEYVRERTVKGPFEARREEMLTQVADITERPDAVETVNEVIEEATDGAGSWTDFEEVFTDRERFRSVKDLVVSEWGNSLKDLDPGTYSLETQLWSSLILADKTDAAGISDGALRAQHLKRSDLDSHIEGLPAGESEREQRLNRQREQARQEALANVREFVEEGRGVGTITLPTGLGKTYTGLSTAMEIRDLHDADGRLIYALPFTSIVDQLVDDVLEVFDTDTAGQELTVHHHLSETVVATDDDSDSYASEEYMLGESWRSGAIVTTFVQLFESLAGPRNAQGLKLPALHDSVIVLDEPQAIPHGWWQLVRRLVRMLVEDYDASVIVMTATQPRIFQAGGMEPHRFIEEPTRYFEGAERVEYVLDASLDEFLGDATQDVAPVGYADAAGAMLESSDATALAICNTIDSAEQLSDEVARQADAVSLNRIHAAGLEEEDPVTATVDRASSRVADGDGVAVAHLSTRMRPRDRLDIIGAAKRLTEREVPLVVVSTQLIEAGVDISFDRVYRDIAPMDSIVQAAGRCNRSFENDQGEVVVWWLDAPDGTEVTPSKAVYSMFGESLLPEVGKALDTVREPGRRRVADTAMARDAVEVYYQRLHDRGLGDARLVDLFEDARAETLGQESLIDTVETVDVIVCRTASEERRLDEILEAVNSGRFVEAKELLDATKELRVSVPLYSDQEREAVAKLTALGEDYNGLRFLKTKENDTGLFDATRGLRLDGGGVDHRFL